MGQERQGQLDAKRWHAVFGRQNQAHDSTVPTIDSADNTFDTPLNALDAPFESLDPAVYTFDQTIDRLVEAFDSAFFGITQP